MKVLSFTKENAVEMLIVG